MALRPDMASTHVLRVQRLYRQGLKCLMNWTVHRELWIHEGNLLRKEFEANRHQDNPRLIEKIISRGEAKLKAHVHPAPYISASFLPRPYHPLPAAPPLHKRGGGAHLPPPPPPPPPLPTPPHSLSPPVGIQPAPRRLCIAHSPPRGLAVPTDFGGSKYMRYANNGAGHNPSVRKPPLMLFFFGCPCWQPIP